MRWNLAAMMAIVTVCSLVFRQPRSSADWSLTVSLPGQKNRPAYRLTVQSDGKTFSQSGKSHFESPVLDPQALTELAAALRNPDLSGADASEPPGEIWEITMEGTTRRVAARADSPPFQRVREALKAAVSPVPEGPGWWISVTQRASQGLWENRSFQVSYLGWATVTYTQPDGSNWSINVARIPDLKRRALAARFRIHPLDGSTAKAGAPYVLGLMADRKHCAFVCADGRFRGAAGETQVLLESCFPTRDFPLEQPWVALSEFRSM